jgi:periplasmic protein TonB
MLALVSQHRLQQRFMPRSNVNRTVGWAIVLGLHVLLGAVLTSGWARKTVDAVHKPPDALVIQEVMLPPPAPLTVPLPPPTMVKTPDAQALAPRVQAPAPNSLATSKLISPPTTPPLAQTIAVPPEVPLAAAPATAVMAAAPAPPPVPAVPTASPATAAPVQAKATSRSDMAVVCPTQAKPDMPPRAVQEGLSGVVKAQALIKGGVVKEVTILSGPRVFHAAVRSAMQQYQCVSDDAEIIATQEFTFKLE